MPAVSFGISLVMNCHKTGIKGRRVFFFFFFPLVEELTHAYSWISQFAMCYRFLRLCRNLWASVSHCRRTVICLGRTLHLGTLLNMLLLSQRVNNFFPALSFLFMDLKRAPMEIWNGVLCDVRNGKPEERLKKKDSNAIFVTDTVGKPSVLCACVCPTVSP